MIVLGLTGSIGMGKTTAAGMFAEAGVPVYSADDAVHRLYSGRAAPLIEATFPGTVENGIVNREKLFKAVIGQPEAIKKLEAVVHPLVREEEDAFRREAEKSGAAIALVDIPLLFETGAEKRVDKVVGGFSARRYPAYPRAGTARNDARKAQGYSRAPDTRC